MPQPNTLNPKTIVQLSFALAFTALLVGGLIMGISPVFVRFAETSSFVSAFWRVLIALPFLGIWAYWEARKQGKTYRASLSTPGILAGIFFAGDLTFWHLSILNTTLANATFMVCLAPVWVVLLSKISIGESTPKRAIGGLVLCLMGLFMLIHASMQFNPDRLTGDIYGLITSLFLGLYFLAMRAGRCQTQSGNLFFTSTCVTTVILFVVALAVGGDMFPQTWVGWSALFTLGAVTHAGGQGLVTVAMGSLTAMFSSLVIFIEAFAAAIAGWLIFDENLGFYEILGGILILMGVWFSRPNKQNQSSLTQAK